MKLHSLDHVMKLHSIDHVMKLHSLDHVMKLHSLDHVMSLTLQSPKTLKLTSYLWPAYSHWHSPASIHSPPSITCPSGQKHPFCVLRPPSGSEQEGAGLGPASMKEEPSGHSGAHSVFLFLRAHPAVLNSAASQAAANWLNTGQAQFLSPKQRHISWTAALTVSVLSITLEHWPSTPAGKEVF